MKPILLLGFIAFLLPGTLSAQLTVWPGDANNNGIVSHVDVLYLGLGFGSTGPVRQGASPNWMPQQMNVFWPQNFSNNLNYAHADCDGNGTINNLDLLMVDTNYNRTTSPVGGMDSTTFGTNASPALALNFLVDSLTVPGVTVVTTDVVLGDSANMVDSLYGIAFTMTYDPMIVDSISFNLGGGWIATSGGGSQIMSDAWVKDSVGEVDIVITRTNQSNASGAGLIGSINIVMDDNIRLAGNYELPIGVKSLFAITSSETGVYLRSVGDTLAIETPLAARTALELPSVRLYPNPAQQFIILESEQLQPVDIQLYNGMGKLVRNFGTQQARQERLDLSQLPAGIYFLELRHHQALVRKKFLLVPR